MEHLIIRTGNKEMQVVDVKLAEFIWSVLKRVLAFSYPGSCKSHNIMVHSVMKMMLTLHTTNKLLWSQPGYIHNDI